MKKNYFPAALLALLISLPATGSIYAADSDPVLVYSPNSQGSQQVLQLNGLPSGCYGLELTLSTNSSGNYSFDFNASLSSDGKYSVEKQADGNITLYIAAGAEPLNVDSSLSLGTLSSADSFSIVSASGKLLDSRMQPQEYSSLPLQKSGQSSGSGNSGSSGRHSISTPGNIKGGSVKASPSNAGKGTKVTLSVLPDTGYYLDSLTVTDKNGNTIRLTEQSSGSFTFTMPDTEVSIIPVFKKGDAPERPAVPDTPPALPFQDVAADDWFYSAVQYAYGSGMMSGTSSDLFSPNVTTTRGMIVTILYRLENRPAVTSAPFLDVPASQYYADAVAWASEKGIVSGYGDGLFGPNDTITREQMASILYRYAKYKGYDMDGSADLSGYADTRSVSAYAITAMRWANANNLITGTSSSTLSPTGSATRAQVASILMRFCENIAE